VTVGPFIGRMATGIIPITIMTIGVMTGTITTIVTGIIIAAGKTLI
jgi:hypothetical protein